jgi:hypothetical protein
MDNLIKQYKKLDLFALQTSIIAQFFIIKYVIPLVQSNVSSLSWIFKFLTFVFTSTALYLLVAKGTIYWFEKIGWKFFNKEINFDGVWNYEHSCYDLLERGTFTKKGTEQITKLIEKLKDNHGQVLIKQDVFGISVKEGAGKLGNEQKSPITTWKVNTVDFYKDGTFVYQFTSTLGGTKFAGIDTLTVTKRDNDKPIEMFGETLLMPENNDFILRGQINLKRVL